MTFHWWYVPLALTLLSGIFFGLGIVSSFNDPFASETTGILGMISFCFLSGAIGALIMGFLK